MHQLFDKINVTFFHNIIFFTVAVMSVKKSSLGLFVASSLPMQYDVISTSYDQDTPIPFSLQHPPPNIRMLSQPPSNNNNNYTQFYVRHVDPNLTGEGLGSYARGSVYPLLRVSLAFGWEISWHPPTALGKNNQSRPFYEDE